MGFHHRDPLMALMVRWLDRRDDYERLDAQLGDGAVVVFQYARADQPADLWAAGADMRRDRQVSRLNPGLQRDDFGTTRLVEWQTAGGRQLRGTLLLPADYRDGAPVPMIVHVYGGSGGAGELHPFDATRQLFATRGWAVFVPEIPVRVGTPMRDIAEALLPGIDAVVALGIADPARLGVWGDSYGGYSVLALLVQTDRFRAAVASASQGNMFGMHSQLEHSGLFGRAVVVERGQGRMGGSPWEQHQRYVENSPYFLLDRVTTPLLLLHGSHDQNTPAHLAEQIYVGLRRRDREVTYVRYEGEDHWWGQFQPANRLDYWQRVVGWFEEQLR